jgi:hypothetical protein
LRSDFYVHWNIASCVFCCTKRVLPQKTLAFFQWEKGAIISEVDNCREDSREVWQPCRDCRYTTKNPKVMNEEEKKQPPPRKKGGRNPKNNPAVYRYTVNFDAVEHARFLTLFEQSGLRSMAQFIAARVFGDEFRIVKTDRAALEYVAKLTALYQQFRAVGVNYNQVTKELHTHFSEKKALALLYKLEKATLELVELSRRIIELSHMFESQWLRR